MRRLTVLLCAALLAATALVPLPVQAVGGDSTNVAPTSNAFCDSGGCHIRIYKFDAAARGFIWHRDWDSTGGWQPWVQEAVPFNNAGNMSESYYRWAVSSIANLECYLPGFGWREASTTSIFDLDAKRATPGTATKSGAFATAAILGSPRFGNTQLLTGPTSYDCSPSLPNQANIGGLTAWSPSVAYMGDGIHVWVTGVDATAFQWTSSFGWNSFGGGSVGSPSAVSWDQAGRLDVFIRATDDQMWHRWFDNGWSPSWEALGGTLRSGPGCSAFQPLRLDCFAVGVDGTTIYHKWWDPSGWQGWESLG